MPFTKRTEEEKAYSSSREYIKDKLLRYSKLIPETGCRIFSGTPHSKTGYGRFRINSKEILAHRAAAFAYGLISSLDSEMFVLHKPECTSKMCIAEEHLYAGTQKDNMRDVNIKFNICNHPDIPENRYLRKDGGTQCKLCSLGRAKRFKQKKREMGNLFNPGSAFE